MEKYLIDGMVFSSKEEYEDAENDIKIIAKIRSVIDLANLKEVLAVYNKAVDTKIFKTLAGINFLKELQDILLIEGLISLEELPPIVIPAPKMEDTAAAEEDAGQSKADVWLFRSIVVNVIFCLVIGIMYVIAYNSDNANIVNYERILDNKYNAMEESMSAHYADIQADNASSLEP